MSNNNHDFKKWLFIRDKNDQIMEAIIKLFSKFHKLSHYRSKNILFVKNFLTSLSLYFIHYIHSEIFIQK